MESGEKLKNNTLKYLIIITILIITILTIFFVILSSSFPQRDIKLVIFNTSNKKMTIEYFIFQGSEENNTAIIKIKTLDPSEIKTLDIKIDKSVNIFKVLIEAINFSNWINSSENGGIRQVDAHAFYYFPNGKFHDLLAVIDISGDTISITRSP